MYKYTDKDILSKLRMFLEEAWEKDIILFYSAFVAPDEDIEGEFDENDIDEMAMDVMDVLYNDFNGELIHCMKAMEFAFGLKNISVDDKDFIFEQMKDANEI